MRSILNRSLFSLSFVACMVVVSTASAGESIFGFSYFGESTRSYDARIEGRGGMGLAYRDSVNANVLQATQLADLSYVTIGLSNTFARRTSEDPSGSITRLGLDTPAVRMGFPLFGRGGLGLGFSARRSTRWSLVRQAEVDDTVIEVIDRSGTLFDIPVQIAWRFGDKLVAGAGMHVLRGNVRMDYLLDLEVGTDPTDTREDIYSGTAPELSLAIHDVGPLSVAGYWVGSFDADVDVRQRGVALEDRTEESRTDTMPARIGVGARIDLPGDWSTGVDFRTEQWGSYEGRSFTYTDGIFDPDGTAVGLQDEVEWRWGLEREARPLGFRATTPLRVGAYWKRWHYQLQGEDVTEWGVTLGSGVALRAGSARADLSIGYSRIGNLDDNGASEDVFRATLSIAGGERWYGSTRR